MTYTIPASLKINADIVADIHNESNFRVVAPPCSAKPLTPKEMTDNLLHHPTRASFFQSLWSANSVYSDGSMFLFPVVPSLLAKRLTAECSFCSADQAAAVGRAISSQVPSTRRVRIIGESRTEYLLGDDDDYKAVAVVNKAKFASILKYGYGAREDLVFCDSHASLVTFKDPDNMIQAGLLPVAAEAKRMVTKPLMTMVDTFLRPNVATIEFGKFKNGPTYKIDGRRESTVKITAPDGISCNIQLEIRKGDYCAWIPCGAGPVAIVLITRPTRKEIVAVLTELAAYVDRVEYVGDKSVKAIPIFEKLLLDTTSDNC